MRESGTPASPEPDETLQDTHFEQDGYKQCASPEPDETEFQGIVRRALGKPAYRPKETKEKSVKIEGTLEWGLSKDSEMFTAVNVASEKLPAGVYSVLLSQDGTIYYDPLEFPGDETVALPGLPCEYVLKQIEKFWGRGDRYAKYGFVTKRGILFYGPPGCGKTSIIRLLCASIVKLGGVVFNMTGFAYAAAELKKFRTVEPTRPVMVLFEDMDSMVGPHLVGDSTRAALSLLDGQDQISNVVYVATTNNPEDIAERFIKRPGRFDLIIGVNMPTTETREAYLRHICKNQVPEDILLELVQKTEGLSLAYLKELASTRLCLDIPLDETLERIKGDFKRKKFTNRKDELGFVMGYKAKDM